MENSVGFVEKMTSIGDVENFYFIELCPKKSVFIIGILHKRTDRDPPKRPVFRLEKSEKERKRHEY